MRVFGDAGGVVIETPNKPKGSPFPFRGVNPGNGLASVEACASTFNRPTDGPKSTMLFTRGGGEEDEDDKDEDDEEGIIIS